MDPQIFLWAYALVLLSCSDNRLGIMHWVWWNTECHVVMGTLHDYMTVHMQPQKITTYLAVWCLWWNRVTGSLSIWERKKGDWVMKLSLVTRKALYGGIEVRTSAYYANVEWRASTGQLYVHTLRVVGTNSGRTCGRLLGGCISGIKRLINAQPAAT